LEDIVKKMRGYPQNQDIWYLAEFMLKDERELIERHPKNFNVRLTKKDRDLCGQSLLNRCYAQSANKSFISAVNQTIPQNPNESTLVD
jgi:hypothetical protein